MDYAWFVISGVQPVSDIGYLKVFQPIQAEAMDLGKIFIIISKLKLPLCP